MELWRINHAVTMPPTAVPSVEREGTVGTTPGRTSRGQHGGIDTKSGDSVFEPICPAAFIERLDDIWSHFWVRGGCGGARW